MKITLFPREGDKKQMEVPTASDAEREANKADCYAYITYLEGGYLEKTIYLPGTGWVVLP